MKDLDQIIFSAFRYALGRRTHIVNTTVEFIMTNVDHLPIFYRQKMIEEINQAERQEYGYSLGEVWNAKSWLTLQDFLKEKLNE